MDAIGRTDIQSVDGSCLTLRCWECRFFEIFCRAVETRLDGKLGGDDSRRVRAGSGAIVVEGACRLPKVIRIAQAAVASGKSQLGTVLISGRDEGVVRARYARHERQSLQSAACNSTDVR